jgi:uncharacterized protein YndB with AHSA1/START domain
MSTTTADVSVVVNAPPDEVWTALTEPAAIRRYYLGATVETDWEVGSPITWSGEWDGKPYQDHGEILTVEPPRELEYSHWSPLSGADDTPDNYHVIDITLDPDGERTKVRLTQANLNGTVTDGDREHRDDYEKNWRTVLEGLKATVES